jgi:hypothetical protein
MIAFNKNAFVLFFTIDNNLIVNKIFVFLYFFVKFYFQHFFFDYKPSLIKEGIKNSIISRFANNRLKSKIRL